MKKILKFLGFTVVGILLAMVLLPIVYKDKIVALIKETINDELNAVVEFDDVSLSLFKSFPNARLTITDFSITGIDTFENIDLIKAKSLYVVSDISPLFKKDQKPSIKYLAISDANFNILKLDSQYANYLITKESEDTSGFNLVLDGYELNNTTITYHDKSLQLLLEAVGLNHKGKGNLSSDVFSLDTKTTADALTVRYENFTYLKEVKTIADLVLQIDLTNEKYSFDNGAVTLNKLSLTGKGTIDFNGDDIYINTELSSLDQTFQNFVTALPFIENNKAYTAKGSADIRLKANGIYNSVKSTYPAFDVLMKVSDGFLQYQGFDYAVSPINANLSVNAKDSQLKDLRIHIPKFNIGINKEKIAGELKIDKASTNPALKGHIKGSLSLENWIKALPMEGIEELSGKILSDISFNGNLSDIENKAYDKVAFDGDFKMSNIRYHAKDMPKTKIESIALQAKPSLVTISSSGIELGSSQLSLSGLIVDPLHFALKDGNLNGKIVVKSELLNLDEWNTSNSPPSNTQSTTSVNIDRYKTSNIDLNVEIRKMLFGQKEYNNLKMEGKLGLNAIDLTTMQMTIDKSDIAVSGIIHNAYNYISSSETLVGNISLTSRYLDLNQFMTESTDDSPSGVILIPQNLDLTIVTDIQKLLYTNYTLTNLKGNVVVSNGEARLEGIDTEILGGKVQFEGLYNTSNPTKPSYNVKLALDKIKIEDAYSTFITMQTLAPVSQYIKGFLNTTLIMSGSITENMTPEFSDINAEGFIETIHSALQNLSIFDQVADKLGVAALKKVDIGTSKNWFNIENGTVELKEKTFTTQDIGMKISGTHQIKGDMRYDLFLKIPRSKISQSNIGGQLDKGFSWIANEARRRGVNIEQGEFIDVKVEIAGRLTRPNLKYFILGSSGKTMAQEVSDEVKTQIDKATDSLKQVVLDRKNMLEDSVRNRLERELESAKEKLMTEAEQRANDALNTVKTEVKREIESRIDSTLSNVISDSLKRKAEEILKSKTGEEVKDIKKKIEEFNPFKKKKTGN